MNQGFHYLFLLAFTNEVSALLCGYDTFVEYNPPGQICCNGTVTRRDSFRNGCCKDTLYNNETDMCCGGAVGPKSWLCCSGVLHPHKDSDSYGCNGTDLYRLPKKDIVKSTTREPSCKGTIFKENKLVCGSSLYNTELETCCNGTVHTKSPNVLCCKDVLYNTSTHVCCDKILRPKSRLNERIRCCGTDPYEPDRSLCCNGIKYEKSPKSYGCCDTKPYRFSRDMCCISKVYGQSKKMQCCGTETFDREKQYCYNDNEILGLYEGKCGKRRYSTLKHVCCDQTLIANKKGYRCCGSSLFNPKVNHCDMKHIVQKGFLWCESGNYNPDTHDCCEGQVMKKDGASWRCCGARMINYDVNGCCGAGHPFNKRNQQCCGGNVIKIEGKCCANQQMNSTQLCCGKTKDRNEEIITKKEPYHDKCCPHKCGGVSYDSVNSICSWKNIVINITKTFNNCGKKEYNPRVDLCCNQKLFRRKQEKGMKCCNPSTIIYHPKSHFCENGEIKRICPKKCKNITLKNFCKKENPKTRKTQKGKIITKEFRILLENHECQCVYARDQGRKCKRNGKQCRRNKKKRKLMGIFVVKTRINSKARVSLLLCGEAPNYKPYDENEKMCCNGTIHKRETHLCCGNIVINKTNSNTVSCNETLEKKTTNIVKTENNESHSGGLTTTYGNIWLCGVSNESRQYNDAKETCCNGTIFNKTGGVFCCKGELNPKTPSWQCCGSIMINLDVSGCCGAGNPYDKTKKQCCGGKLAEIKDKCCAGKVVDTKTQVCCSSNPLTNETIIQKRRSTHDKCCPTLNGGKSYDSFHFECRWKSKIVPVCPTECRPNGMILVENFCKNRKNGTKPKVITKRKLMRRIIQRKRHKLCQRIYRSRKNRLCNLENINNGKKCKLVGISIVKKGKRGKERNLFMYYPRKRKFLRKKCKVIFNKRK